MKQLNDNSSQTLISWVLLITFIYIVTDFKHILPLPAMQLDVCCD